MKIGIVHFDLGHAHGDSRCVPSFAARLERLGHQVAIYTTAFDPSTFADLWRGRRVVIVPQSSSAAALTRSGESIWEKARARLRARRWSLAAARSLAAALPGDLDILDCHNFYTYRTGFFYRKRNPRTKIVWTMHDPPFTYRKKNSYLLDILSRVYARWEEWREAKFYRAVDGVVAPDLRGQAIVDRLGLPGKIVYMGLDFDRFFRPVRAGGSGRRVRLMSVGSLSPYRRFEDAVAAVAILRRRGYEAYATIVGKQVWEHAAYRREFMDFVERSGAAPYVKLFFDGISDEELLRAYDESDIFVFPNNTEIWGMAPFEAAARGLPLIVSRVSSLTEVLADGEHALLVDPLAPEQIADRTEKLLADPDLRRRLAENCQQYVREHLSWEGYARGFLETANPSGV